MPIIHPDGRLVVRFWPEARERGYDFWMHPQKSMRLGIPLDGALSKLNLEYAGYNNVPPEEAITTVLEILELAMKREFNTMVMRGYLRVDVASMSIKGGYILDMIWAEDSCVLPWEGPKTTEFLKRVIEYWEPIDSSIVDKAKDLLSLYIAERI